MRHAPNGTAGQSYTRGEAGYEDARTATMWNARTPGRFPAHIVQANDERDVIEAVKRAARERLHVTVRAGGHSWAGNHVRDGALLLDVSRLREVSIDERAMRATTGPGRAGHELAAMLGARDLFFPAGHCIGVCVGGYLLQGGFGWNGRALGPACASVVGIDVVLADGSLVHANEEENADVFWAARGAGPGFFGVVTRFHLRTYRKPRVIGFGMQAFSVAHLDEVFRWAHAARHDVPRSVELQLLIARDVPGVRGPAIVVFSPVFEESWGGALDALRFQNGSAVRRHARWTLPFVPSGVKPMYHLVRSHYPDGQRYAVDNMWTHASIDALLPGLHRIADTLPDAPSHMLWMNWSPSGPRPDMAFSMEDETYVALYSVWKRAEHDARFAAWPVEHMRAMAPLASGIQLADENLGQRPARFVSEAALARLDAIRAARDPDGRFLPWMGRPSAPRAEAVAP